MPSGEGWCKNMRILILSDSHSSLHTMKDYVLAVKPDQIIHLGDYYDDAGVLREEFPHIPLIQVPGNCDGWRMVAVGAPETIVTTLGGVRFFLTHGHRHHVKMTLSCLIADARNVQAQVALFGHTHQALCQIEDDGLWVVNPGSCGYGGGTAAVIEVEQGRLTDCRILRSVEEFV